MLSKDKMWSPEQGKGCVYVNKPHSAAGEAVLGHSWGCTPGTPPANWPHPGPMDCDPISMGAQGVITPGACLSISSHSCAPPQSNPHNEHGKWVPWKSISHTSIDSSKVCHSIRWGLLIKVADRNITWKVWHFCYKSFCTKQWSQYFPKTFLKPQLI